MITDLAVEWSYSAYVRMAKDRARVRARARVCVCVFVRALLDRWVCLLLSFFLKEVKTAVFCLSQPS